MKVITTMYKGEGKAAEPIRKLSKKQRRIKKTILRQARFIRHKGMDGNKIHKVTIIFYWNRDIGYYAYAFTDTPWEFVAYKERGKTYE